MRCPFCGDETNKVIDTRLARDGAEIRRRRECLECGQRFTTRERVESVMPRVIKRDARREDWDRAKLLAGIEQACTKRPVPTEAVTRLVDRLERELQELGETEISSRAVGERALRELTRLDPFAAVRFASVFLDFQTAADYDRFFASLPGEAGDAGGGGSEP